MNSPQQLHDVHLRATFVDWTISRDRMIGCTWNGRRNCLPESYGAAPTLWDEKEASGAVDFLWTFCTFSIQGAARVTICCTIVCARPEDLLSAGSTMA
jgi:hypothetical protein